MTKLNKIIIATFLFCSVLIIFSSLNLFKLVINTPAKITISNIQLNIEVASNPETWQKGLSGREGLCENCGMLFVFPDKKAKEFWMKDMLFPLDIVWISDDVVAGVSRELPAPKSNELPVIVQSPEDVNFVLEVNSGKAANFNKGDKVKIDY